MKKEVAEPVAEQIISNTQTMTLLNSNSINSKDSIVQACCLQILGLLYKHVMQQKKDANPATLLKIDVAKIIDIFERNL